MTRLMRRPRLRVVIILFDMLNSHFKDQVPARIQLTKYLNEQIQPGTMVALLGLGRGGLRMYHDLTSDTQGLGKELADAMATGRHSISTNLQGEMSETEAEEAFVGHGGFAQTSSSGRSDQKIIVLDTLDGVQEYRRRVCQYSRPQVAGLGDGRISFHARRFEGRRKRHGGRGQGQPGRHPAGLSVGLAGAERCEHRALSRGHARPDEHRSAGRDLQGQARRQRQPGARQVPAGEAGQERRQHPVHDVVCR